MNPMQILQAIQNPKQFITNMLGNQINNPMFSNLINNAEKGNKKEVETFARNLCKQRNIDFDKEFSSFMSMVNKK